MMKQGLLIHYIIGICALMLAIVAVYYIDQNKGNVVSVGIIAFAGSFVAISQYLIIKNKKKQK